MRNFVHTSLRTAINHYLTSTYSLLNSLSIVSRQSVLAIILLCLTLGVGNAWGTTQTFTFNTDDGLSELSITKPGSDGSGTSLDASHDYTLGVVTMNITHGGTDTRVWRAGGKNAGALDLRIYNSGGSLTFSVASGYYINSVQINNKTNLSASSPTGGSWSSNTWSPAASTYPTSATFTASGTANITTIVVTYSSSCTAISPSVTYRATTLYKGETASVSSITGNTGSASVTYSSSNSTVASVNSSTGVVTAGQAGTAKITASFAATGGYCAKDVEIDFTVRYKVKWSVNGDDSYETGSPTTYIGTHNTKVATLPTDPGSALCDGSKVFVGWTTSSYSHASTPPGTLFTTTAGAPNVTNNVTYYAVYATRGGSAPSPASVSFTYASHTGWTLGGTYSDNTSYYLLKAKSGSKGYVESPTISDMSTITSVVVHAGFYGGSDYGTFKVYGGSTQYGTSQSPGSKSDNEFTISPATNPLSGSGKIKIINAGSNDNDNGTRLFSATVNYTTGGYTYSNYATSCCTALGSINGSFF